MPPSYVFESRWQLPAPMEETYDVLVDVERYPEWWPQVRAVAKLGEDHALVVCRSALPLSLYVEMRPLVRDRTGGVLEASLAGDLHGWSRFTLAPRDGRLDVRFEQQVTTPTRLMRVLGAVARPALLANHELMMRSARRGLEQRLALEPRPTAPGADRTTAPCH